MSAPQFACWVLLVFLLAPVVAWGQAERLPADDRRTLELVDRIKELIRRWEQNRTANPALLNELRELARRYDWPWRARLLVDDFGDGDYTANPSWTVRGGQFQVVRGGGLQTSVSLRTMGGGEEGERTRELSPSELFGAILKQAAEPSGRVPLRDSTGSSEISTAVAIGNSFAIRVQMASADKNSSRARIEFGPYRGDGREWGVRLAYNPRERPSFEMLRLSPGRSVIVETYDVFSNLEDGNAHEIEWRREDDGAMFVLLNDREIIRTVDRATDFFDGFTIVNSGGDYVFERIEIFGMER
jgi:hypothetical protein